MHRVACVLRLRVGCAHFLSRRHALLIVDEQNGPLLLDLAAANGTSIDNEQLAPFIPVPVRCTSKVRFGRSKREYSISVDTTNEQQKKEEMYAKIARDDSAASHSDTTVFVA